MFSPYGYGQQYGQQYGQYPQQQYGAQQTQRRYGGFERFNLSRTAQQSAMSPYGTQTHYQGQQQFYRPPHAPQYNYQTYSAQSAHPPQRPGVESVYGDDPTFEHNGKTYYLHPDGLYRPTPAEGSAVGTSSARKQVGQDIIHRSVYGDVDIPDDMSITDFVFKNIATSDEVAILDGPSGRAYTHRQCHALITKFASALARKGFKKGDCLAIILPNCPEYTIIFHGVASLGGISTTVNPTYTQQSIAHQLKDANATYIVTAGPLLEASEGAAEESGQSIVDIILLGDAPEGKTSLAEMLADDGSAFPTDVVINPKEDVVALPYSSGTTGLPKGVMLTHHSLISNLSQITHPELLSLGTDDSMIAVLPFFHIYGLVVILNCALMQGCKIVCMPRFIPGDFLTYIQQHKVTIAPVVPPIVTFLAKHPVVDKFDLSSLREVFSGAAPLGSELTEMATARLGVVIRQGYGMTEMSPASHVSPKDGGAPGSCGRLVPNSELKLVDVTTGECVGVGQEGELWIRGSNNMMGYLNNAEATAITIDDEGFLHTGDVGYVDESGNFFIVDRVKELIKYKGFQVAPAELEALLQGHPAVADVAVIPIPDEDAGELPKAYVVKKEGAEVTEEDIMEFVAGQVEKYKQIRVVEFTNEIPKSASGKILRRILKQQHKAKSEGIDIDCSSTGEVETPVGRAHVKTPGIVDFVAEGILPAPVILKLSPWGDSMEGIQLGGRQVEDDVDVLVELADGTAKVTISGELAAEVSEGATVTFIDYFR